MYIRIFHIIIFLLLLSPRLSTHAAHLPPQLVFNVERDVLYNDLKSLGPLYKYYDIEPYLQFSEYNPNNPTVTGRTAFLKLNETPIGFINYSIKRHFYILDRSYVDT